MIHFFLFSLTYNPKLQSNIQLNVASALVGGDSPNQSPMMYSWKCPGNINHANK